MIQLPFIELVNKEEKVMIADAQKYHQQQVVVRGFLYEANDNQWILSSEPNLKTCCIGSNSKGSRQIFLSPDFKGIKSIQPVNLKGFFLVTPIYNDQQHLIRIFELYDAVLN